MQTTPWHREEKLLNHHETPGRQIKQSNQLSLLSAKNLKQPLIVGSVYRPTDNNYEYAEDLCKAVTHIGSTYKNSIPFGLEAISTCQISTGRPIL